MTTADSGDCTNESNTRAEPVLSYSNILSNSIVFGNLIQAGRIDNIVMSSSTIPRIPKQLPSKPSIFCGRMAELNILDRLVAERTGSENPMGAVVISGQAGIGKTAFACKWAADIAQLFPDGQLFFDFRGFDPSDTPADANMALSSFLRSFGVDTAKIPVSLADKEAAFRTLIGDGRVLILLDNVSNAKDVRPLLPGSSASFVLVTSRNALSGLVARDGAARITLDVLSQTESVELISKIVGLETVDSTPSATVKRICELCGFLPLSLRIVAERVLVDELQLEGLARELEFASQRLDMLRTGDDDLADLRAALSWSYFSLPMEVASVFRSMGALVGSEASSRAIAATAGIGLPAAIDRLDYLKRSSMIEMVAVGRYHLHDSEAYAELLVGAASPQVSDSLDRSTSDFRISLSVRLYARELIHLEPSNELKSATSRSREWYLLSAIRANNIAFPHAPIRLEPVASTMVDYRVEEEIFTEDSAVEWFDHELKNLIQSILNTRDAGDYRSAVGIFQALKSYFILKKHWQEWILGGEAALESAQELRDVEAEATCCASLALAYQDLERFEDARSSYERALSIRRSLGDKNGQAAVLHNMGQFYRAHGEFDKAMQSYSLAIPFWDTADNRRGMGLTLNNIGEVYGDKSRPLDGIEYSEQALRIAVAEGDRWSEGNACYNLAIFNFSLGRLDSADDFISTVMSIRRGIDDKWGEARALVVAGEIADARGKRATASQMRSEALQLFEQLGDPRRVLLERRIREAQDSSA